MPDYTGIITNGQPNYARFDLLLKWLSQNNGFWFKCTFKIIGQKRDPKTVEQLGYYWGLLLPEIHKQLIEDGHTVALEAYGIKKEIPITLDATHELLTAFCGFVGEDGKAIRLSEMDKYNTVKFVDNVLEFAVANLGMNEEQLKAWRQTKEKDKTNVI